MKKETTSVKNLIGPIIILLFAIPVIADEVCPRFENFFVKNVYEGVVVQPKIKTSDERDLYNHLYWADKPNFAGHYFINIFGCGAACSYGAILDVTTGKAWWLPYHLGWADPNFFNPISYQLNSSLIVFRGHPDENGPNGEYYYNFQNGKFIKVAEIPLPGIYQEEVYSDKP